MRFGFTFTWNTFLVTFFWLTGITLRSQILASKKRCSVLAGVSGFVLTNPGPNWVSRLVLTNSE
jgi:hypothetical protein